MTYSCSFDVKIKDASFRAFDVHNPNSDAQHNMGFSHALQCLLACISKMEIEGITSCSAYSFLKKVKTCLQSIFTSNLQGGNDQFYYQFFVYLHYLTTRTILHTHTNTNTTILKMNSKMQGPVVQETNGHCISHLNIEIHSPRNHTLWWARRAGVLSEKPNSCAMTLFTSSTC